MEQLKSKLSNEVLVRLKFLHWQAKEVQKDYQQALTNAFKRKSVVIGGFFPRVRENDGALYIYWDKYKVENGSIHLKKNGKTYRISKSVPKNKGIEPYPATSFQKMGVHAWELPLILDAESELNLIRIEVQYWTSVLKALRRRL